MRPIYKAAISVACVIAAIVASYYAARVPLATPSIETPAASKPDSQSATPPPIADAVPAIQPPASIHPAVSNPQAAMEILPDLATLYRTLRQNRNGADLLAARRILGECWTLGSKTNEYYAVANQLPTKFIAPNPSLRQRSAATEILSRCAGFEAWDKSQYAFEIKTIDGELAALADLAARVDSTAKSRSAFDKSLLRDVLTSQDPYLIDAAEAGLMSLWRQKLPGPISQTDYVNARTAFEFSTCDIGADCTAKSIRALTQCVHHDELCDMSVDSQYEVGIDPNKMQAVRTFREQFTQLLKNQNLEAFGLQ